MKTIRTAPHEYNCVLPDLCALLKDSVEGGASVGFLAPLAPASAANAGTAPTPSPFESPFRRHGELFRGMVVLQPRLADKEQM
jgi:hypothetical protein